MARRSTCGLETARKGRGWRSDRGPPQILTWSSQATPRPFSRWPPEGLAPRRRCNRERYGSRESARRTGKPCSRGARVWSGRPQRRVRLERRGHPANYASRERCSGRGRHSELHTGIAVCRACALILPAHHSIYHLQKECRHPFRERPQFIVISVMGVMSSTFPDTNGVFYVTINSWRVWGPSRHRHGERHQENPMGKRLPRYRDGDDAHDGQLRSYSRQGRAPLLRRLSYCFNLTRRTRRWEQKTLFLCCSRAYNLCRVFSDWLITRRSHPTTDHLCRRVGSEHRRDSN